MRMPSVDLGLVSLAAVLTASLAFNVRLGLEATATPQVFVETGFLLGTRLPVLSAAGPGEPERPLVFTRNTLVYVFSPRCEWSRSNYANVKAIVEAAEKNYAVLSIYAKPHDTDGEVLSYLASHPLPGQVVGVDLTRTTVPDDLATRFSTPQLLVVAPGGLIRRAWAGALFEPRQADAEGYFGLKLPGARMVGGMASPEPPGTATR